MWNVSGITVGWLSYKWTKLLSKSRRGALNKGLSSINVANSVMEPFSKKYGLNLLFSSWELILYPEAQLVNNSS